MIGDMFSSTAQYSTPSDQTFGTYDFSTLGLSMDDESAILREENIELQIDHRNNPDVNEGHRNVSPHKQLHPTINF